MPTSLAFRRVSPSRTTVCVLLVAGALVATMIGVLWYGDNVVAFGPTGSTRCGRAYQELSNFWNSGEIGGRCHLARRERLWLGVHAGGAMLIVTTAIVLLGRVTRRMRNG